MVTEEKEAHVPGGQVRTFLIADVRGYTRFTVEQGDEAAARLAGKFAAVGRQVVSTHAGQVIELRGDEALAVFASARQALRAAVALQERCSQDTMADASLPLKVGIGLDAGEAVAVEGGYRGTALNLAARLCALAGPGEVLTSDGVVHLARTVEGLEYIERGPVHLKGFGEPVRAVEVLPAANGESPGRRAPAEQSAGMYRVRLLGPFAVVRDDSILDASRWRRQVGRLLRLLATSSGKRRMREDVIELFWPDASPEAGAGNLRLLTYRLRQALGNPDPPPVTSDGDWIALNPVYQWEVDLDRFEELTGRAGDDVATLEEAADLVQGEPLPEDRYEDWAAPVREHVQRRWREICLQLARLHARRGANQEAAGWYERLLESDPLNEEAVQGLLEILLERGNRTKALRRYRQFERRLEDELGVPPQPETMALVAAIEERKASQIDRSELPTHEQQRSLAAVIPMYPLPRSGPLVGRDEELAQMLAALPGRREPQVSAPVRLLLVAAEAGMGKTRLLAELAERAREESLLTLAGGCYEQEGKLPYGPIHDALLDYVRGEPEAAVRSRLGDLLPELARILPELRTRLPDIPEPMMGDAEGQRLRLFSTVAQVLERVSEGGAVVLILDDLHWADDASLQLLHYLLRQRGLDRVLVVGAYRTEEVASETPLAQLEAEARDEAWAALFPLMPLEEDSLEDVLAERMDGRFAKSAVTALQERSGGNPFFALQMARLLAQEGRLVEGEEGWCLAEGASVELPPEVRATVARRLRRLARREREVLTLGAVLGREFGYPALEAVWSRDEDALYTAIETSMSEQVLTETDDGYAFGHPLLHEVVYARVPSGQRVRLHRKAGVALETLYGERPNGHAAELARHFLQGGDRVRALAYTMHAGDQAEAAFAHGEAERQYRTALELARGLGDDAIEAEALAKLGSALRAAGRDAEAIEVLEEAADMYRGAGDAGAEARVTAEIGWALQERHFKDLDREGAAAARLEVALERLRESAPARDIAALLVTLSTLLARCGRIEQALDAATQAAELARSVGDEHIRATAEGRRGLALKVLLRFEEGKQALETAIPLLEVAGDVDPLIRSLDNLGDIYARTGDLPTARQHRRRALDLAQRWGNPSRTILQAEQLAQAAYDASDWKQARADYEHAADLARKLPANRRSNSPLVSLAWLAMHQGEWEDARGYCEECATRSERMGDRKALADIESLRAEHDVWEGRPLEALARLELLAARPDLRPDQVVDCLSLLSETRLQLGDVAAAEELAARALERARGLMEAFWPLEPLRVQAMTVARQGRWDEAEQALDEALALARGCYEVYEEARILHGFGLVFSQKGEKGRAREYLEEALAIFRRLGAKPNVERTEQALAQLQ
jgi:DNA-binding SARP family transcriptional activator/class 3 adenylate cyclase